MVVGRELERGLIKKDKLERENGEGERESKRVREKGGSV